MAKSCLPAFPLVVFGVVEPVLLVWAYITAIQDPTGFFAAQVPNAPLPPPSSSSSSSTSTIPPQALVLQLQLVNAYLLLAAVAVICSWTPQAAVARRYLAAVALADYGHVWACYRGVGPDVFWHPPAWNGMLWGGVGVSAVLNVLRWATVAGVFGGLGVGKERRGVAGRKSA